MNLNNNLSLDYSGNGNGNGKIITNKEADKKNNNKRSKTKSKSKGNKYENIIAKELGNWLFSDQDVFERHITSGAKKSVYVGDIIPIKQIDWKGFPFIIECKHGYENQIPNFNNQSIVRQWVNKSINEKTQNQKYLWLIMRFHGFSDLILTDHMLNNIHWELAINVLDSDYKNNRKNYVCFIYSFKKIKFKKLEELYSKNMDILDTINYYSKKNR